MCGGCFSSNTLSFLSMTLSDSDLSQVFARSLCDRKGLVRRCRIHILFDCRPTVILRIPQDFSKCREINCSLGWFAEKIHADRNSERNLLVLNPLTNNGIDALQMQIADPVMMPSEEADRVAAAVTMMPCIQA